MKINEVSEKYHLSIATLRYYEKMGLIGPVKRVNGIRDFQEEDLERITFIQRMKETGLSLEAMKTYFDFLAQGDSTLEARLEILEAQEKVTLEKIENLQKSLEFLEFKINLTKSKMGSRKGWQI